MRMQSGTWDSRTQLGTGQGLRLVPGARGDAPTITGHPEKKQPVTATQVTCMAKQDLPQGTEALDTIPCSLVLLGRDFVESALGTAAGMFCFFSSLFKGETRRDSRKRRRNPTALSRGFMAKP